jgi:hypothetical protein
MSSWLICTPSQSSFTQIGAVVQVKAATLADRLQGVGTRAMVLSSTPFNVQLKAATSPPSG